MTEYLDFAVGAGLLALGYLGGRIQRRRKPDTPDTPRAECACGHSLGEHQPDTGRCLVEVKRAHYWANGSRNGDEWVPCACVQYVGPRPVDQLFALPTLPPAGE